MSSKCVFVCPWFHTCMFISVSLKRTVKNRCACAHACVHTSTYAWQCVLGGDKHLSPEAAFRFPLTSSVKSAQSLHCHLPATREKPAPNTDKLICLAASMLAHTHTHAVKDTYIYIPFAYTHAQSFVSKGLSTFFLN